MLNRTQTALSASALTIASALAVVDTANGAASSVKFAAVVDFALAVATETHLERRKGSNMETDDKGRALFVRETAKKARKTLHQALLQARGFTDDTDDSAEAVKGRRDVDNIASLASTFSQYAVSAMLTQPVVLTDTVDGEEVSRMPMLGEAATTETDLRRIVETFALTATGGAATYNALELARGRKWEAPAPVVAKADGASEAEAEPDPFGELVDVPQDAVEEGEPEGEPVTTASVPEVLAWLRAETDPANVELIRAFAAEVMAEYRAAQKEQARRERQA